MHFVSDGKTCRVSILFIDSVFHGNRILNLTTRSMLNEYASAYEKISPENTHFHSKRLLFFSMLACTVTAW